MNIRTINKSSVSIFLSILTVSVIIYSRRGWKDEKAVIYWDVVSYYAYLPATFIFNDIHLEKQETYMNGIFWPGKSPNGGNVIKTTMGLSFMYAPFFFAGHVAAKIFDYPAFGFSPPYKIALLAGAVFYLFIALIFLRKSLRKFFSDDIVALTLFAVALGTNLTHYASREATMSHVFSFTLFSIFIWLTIRWHKKPKLKYLVLLGALSGLITLIRPTNILILIFFFLYDVDSFSALKQKVKVFVRNFHWPLIMLLLFIAVWIPQFIYWKIVTGNFLYYSYTNETFFFTQPQIINGLFSYRKGWFLYTPMMMLAVVGILFMFRHRRNMALAVTVFTIINVYVILSWWSWWYGGGFGLRAMIDSYALLAFPFATLLKVASQKRIFSKPVIILVFLLVFHNLFQLEQYKHGSIHFDSMTKEAYWNSFGRLRPTTEYWSLLKPPDYERAVKGEEEY